MTDPVLIRRCTVMSLSVSDSETAAHAAFVLAQKLTKSCTALIVSTPMSEQTAQTETRRNTRIGPNVLAKGAEAVGLETDIKPLSFEEALSELKVVPQDDFIILLQPDHPLDRQTPSFQRLSKAALRAPGRTIYVPRQTGETGEYILIAGSSPTLAAFASGLSSQTGLRPTNSRFPPRSLNFESLLFPCPWPNVQPCSSLEDADYSAGPSAYMKLAALTGIPVLVL